jgi:uncharacterized protein YuzE
VYWDHAREAVTAMVLKVAIHGGKWAEYDPDADALFVYLSDGEYHRGRDLDESRRVDNAVDGAPVGIEVLSPAAAGIDVTGSSSSADSSSALAHCAPSRCRTRVMPDLRLRSPGEATRYGRFPRHESVPR